MNKIYYGVRIKLVIVLDCRQELDLLDLTSIFFFLLSFNLLLCLLLV